MQTCPRGCSPVQGHRPRPSNGLLRVKGERLVYGSELATASNSSSESRRLCVPFTDPNVSTRMAEPSARDHMIPAPAYALACQNFAECPLTTASLYVRSTTPGCGRPAAAGHHIEIESPRDAVARRAGSLE